MAGFRTAEQPISPGLLSRKVSGVSVTESDVQCTSATHSTVTSPSDKGLGGPSPDMGMIKLGERTCYGRVRGTKLPRCNLTPDDGDGGER